MSGRPSGSAVSTVPKPQGGTSWTYGGRHQGVLELDPDTGTARRVAKLDG